MAKSTISIVIFMAMFNYQRDPVGMLMISRDWLDPSWRFPKQCTTQVEWSFWLTILTRVQVDFPDISGIVASNETAAVPSQILVFRSVIFEFLAFPKLAACLQYAPVYVCFTNVTVVTNPAVPPSGFVYDFSCSCKLQLSEWFCMIDVLCQLSYSVAVILW